MDYKSDQRLEMKDIILKVYLQPKSSKNEIIGPYRDGIKVKVAAPPIKGKANETLIQLLAKEFGISPSSIEILRGVHSREKTLRILGNGDLKLHSRWTGLNPTGHSDGPHSSK